MPTGDGDQQNDAPPPESALRDVLDSERRRKLLSLIAEGGETSITDAARSIAAAERGLSPEAVPSEASDEIEQSLYQDHLPKLTALEIVAFDSLVATVDDGENTERLFEYWKRASEESELPAPSDVTVSTV